MRRGGSIARVREYYDQMIQHEAQRLGENIYRRLERDMTIRTILRHVPRGARILDVGGGPGAYLEPLTRVGYDAWLCDLSAKSVQRARAEARRLGLPRPVERVRRRSATDLDGYLSSSFGAALVAGPLYHLVEPAAQRRALDELVRVVEPGGTLVCNILPRLHPLRYLLREGSEASWRCLERLDWDRLLDGGRYQNPDDDPLFFTDARLWQPASFCEFLGSVGCEVIDLLSAESFCAFFDVPLASWISSEARYQRLLSLVERTARAPDLIGAAEHVLVVARTPGRPRPSKKV